MANTIEGEFVVVSSGEQDKKSAKIPKEEAMDIICDKISEGIVLSTIVKMPGMPALRTVYDWIEADSAFAERMNRARECGADAIAMECLAIAEEYPEYTNTAFGNKVDAGFIQWQKQRIETRLKLLAKWHPKKYGEKLDLNHGVQPDNPLASLMQRVQGTSLPLATRPVEEGDEDDE